MSTRQLSARETQIVELCIEGLTNEAIAQRLGISIGTVDTYWVRIKLKVGGSGRTGTVVRVIRERAELALREANIERKGIAEIIAENQKTVMEHRAALALLQLAMDQIKSTVWATDMDLSIQIIANGEFPSEHFGVTWEVGKTIYEIFATEDPEYPGIAAHLAAIRGERTELRLPGQFSNTVLRTLPLRDDAGEIMGCISILNIVSP
jgi:DNA-binding CsgD family transcriptional regulator